MRIPLFLCAAVPCAAFSPAGSPKRSLQSVFSPPSDSILACPLTKGPLTAERSVLGGQVRAAKVSAEGVRYPVSSLYADLVPAGRTGPISLDNLAAELQDAFASRAQTQLCSSERVMRL